MHISRVLSGDKLLTHGNIRVKSNLLKYCLFGDRFSESRILDYHKLFRETIIQSSAICDLIQVYEYLHDSIILNFVVTKDLEISIRYQDHQDCMKYCTLIFSNAHVVSMNKVLRTGRIGRINKLLHPYIWLYEEIYPYRGRWCITIQFIPSENIRSGDFFPIVTIDFDKVNIKQ
jgi:hypothetical protein